jgi:hypothetical protein
MLTLSLSPFLPSHPAFDTDMFCNSFFFDLILFFHVLPTLNDVDIIITHLLTQVVQETKDLLQEFGYGFEQRGVVSVKGKGMLRTFYLVSAPNKK